jgi:hypothetical protein
MNTVNDSERFRSEFQFELVGPGAKLTDKQFSNIEREVLIWSLKESVPAEVMRTLAGFSVVIYHSLDVGSAYGRSLHQHLMYGIFRELLIRDGVAFKYLGS